LKGLRKHVRGLKKEYPKKSELQLCEILIERKGLEGQFEAQTLRRKLQIAKKLGKKRANGTIPSRNPRPAVDDWD
jgi:hypothetical protein